MSKPTTMIGQLPMNTLGESIGAWDDFYKRHYEWMMDLSRSINANDADRITERIMAKLLLRRPSSVVRGTREGIGHEISTIYPDLADIIRAKSGQVHSYELMLQHYSPN